MPAGEAAGAEAVGERACCGGPRGSAAAGYAVGEARWGAAAGEAGGCGAGDPVGVQPVQKRYESGAVRQSGDERISVFEGGAVND